MTDNQDDLFSVKLNRRFPILLRTVVFIVLPLLALMLYGRYVYISSVPSEQGQLQLSGLKQAVDIQFDEHGKPAVTAASDLDAYFAQGYLHASARLWQMELQRRMVQGRLAELFGQGAVSTDIWMRVLGLRRAAQSSWQSLNDDTKAALQAYSDGVNAYLTSGHPLGPEFAAFDVEPAPWQPLDSLAWQKSFALSLGLNMYDEINRVKALEHISAEQLASFYPFDPAQATMIAEHPTDSTPATTVFANWQALADTLRRDWQVGGLYVGSNTWAISGKYSQSGGALLANDPHLSVQHPSLWYAIALKGDRLNVHGMSLVGLPGVMLGANEHIAWGAASLMSDQQDLFVLDTIKGDSGHYRTKNGLAEIVIREEQINIKRQSPEFLYNAYKPIKLKVRETAIGPIVSDVVDSGGLTLALRWSALDKIDKTVQSLLSLQYADDWQSFRQALSTFKNPGMNFSYADKKGNIGSQAAAKLPQRGFGVGVDLTKADDPAHYWQGYVPFEQLPSRYNPPSGMIVNANNAIASEVAISHEWAPNTRAKRIEQVLREAVTQGKKLSVDDMARLQNDVVDNAALKLSKVLLVQKDKALALLSKEQNDSGEQALAALAKWQGDYSIDSSAASVYFYWRGELIKQLFDISNSNESGFTLAANVERALLARVDETAILKVLQSSQNPWCAAKQCDEIVAQSFVDAIAQLKKETRSYDLDDWRWGELHQVEYRYRPFSEVKLLEPWYSHRQGAAGGANTVNAANSAKLEDIGYLQTFGAAMRAVYDLADDSQGGYRLPMGQSGHIMSANYDDQLEGFRAGTLTPFNANNVASQLTLVPKEMR